MDRRDKIKKAMTPSCRKDFVSILSILSIPVNFYPEQGFVKGEI
jgi:hypothetical protein